MSSSSTRRSTRLASSGSSGGPQIPSPVMRIAPKPKRFTSRSPPRVNVPSVISSRLDDIPAVEDHGLESEGDLVIEELYFVARGRAEFGVGDQTLDAPVLAIGATKGAAFTPSSWETS